MSGGGYVWGGGVYVHRGRYVQGWVYLGVVMSTGLSTYSTWTLDLGYPYKVAVIELFNEEMQDEAELICEILTELSNHR